MREGEIVPFRRPASFVYTPRFQQDPHKGFVVSTDNRQETLFARLEESRRALEDRTKKAREAWTTHFYDSVDDVVFDACLKSVARIDGRGIEGNEKIKRIIEGCTLLEDITELIVAADKDGYHAVFSYEEGTRLFVSYKQQEDCWTLWKYHRKTEAVQRVQFLQQKEPQIKEDYDRINGITENLGVLLHTHDKKIYASLCIGRKSPGVYMPPLQRSYSRCDAVVKDFEKIIPRALQEAFPSSKEKRLLKEEGKEMLFKLSFQGFGYTGEDQALRCILKTAYTHEIQKGILMIVENVHALYRKNEQPLQERENAQQKDLTVDEWVEEIYLKSAGREDVAAQRIVDKNDPMYNLLFKKHKRPQHTFGEPFTVRTVLITPTEEGIHATYARTISKSKMK